MFDLSSTHFYPKLHTFFFFRGENNTLGTFGSQAPHPLTLAFPNSGGPAHSLGGHLRHQVEGGEASVEEVVPVTTHLYSVQPIAYSGEGAVVGDAATKEGLGGPAGRQTQREGRLGNPSAPPSETPRHLSSPAGPHDSASSSTVSKWPRDAGHMLPYPEPDALHIHDTPVVRSFRVLFVLPFCVKVGKSSTLTVRSGPPGFCGYGGYHGYCGMHLDRMGRGHRVMSTRLFAFEKLRYNLLPLHFFPQIVEACSVHDTRFGYCC